MRETSSPRAGAWRKPLSIGAIDRNSPDPHEMTDLGGI